MSRMKLQEEVERVVQKLKDKEYGNGDLPRDMYSFFYFCDTAQVVSGGENNEDSDSSASLPLRFDWRVIFWVFTVFIFQIAMYCLVLADLLDYDENIRPLFDPPPDVTKVVRVAQYAAIFIAVWIQEDIIESFDVFTHTDDHQ
eukprot:10636367-Ditylum_brightwellii.AAC.1